VTGLRELAVDASVPSDASFADAARALAGAGTAAVAVLSDTRVVGLVTTDDVLRGLFPGYLGELEHTAFIEDETVVAQLERAQGVAAHMRAPVTVDVDSGLAHLAERFLHQSAAALVVVDRGSYVGVIDEIAFVRAVVAAAEG
jgi:CBS domain-containing protein